MRRGGRSWERSEQGKRLIHEADELVHRFQNRFSLTRPLLRERYEKAEFVLHLHVRSVVSEFQSHQLCAVCNRDDGSRSTAEGQPLNVEIFTGATDESLALPGGTADHNEQFVLVPNVEL